MVTHLIHHPLTSLANVLPQTLLTDLIIKPHTLLTALRMAASVSLPSVPSPVSAINTVRRRTAPEAVVPKNRSSLTTQNPSKVLVVVTARHSHMILSLDREAVALVRQLPASWERWVFSEFFLPLSDCLRITMASAASQTIFPSPGTPFSI